MAGNRLFPADFSFIISLFYTTEYNSFLITNYVSTFSSINKGGLPFSISTADSSSLYLNSFPS